MKYLRSLFVLYLGLFLASPAMFSQDKTTIKDKSKSVEIKINLMVLNPENKFIDDVKLEDLKIFEDGVAQNINYFVRKPSPLNVGLVFDNSGSAREYLNEVSSAGKILVANLDSQDEAFVVRFTDSDNIAVIQDWTSNKSSLDEAINNLYIEAGPTAVLDAIYLSAGKILEREKTDKSKRYGIVLFSDAEDRDSYYKFKEVSKLFQGTDLQVYLISYAENAPLEKKKAIKLANSIPIEIGGAVYPLAKKHSKDELLAALKSVLIELRSNYIIGYTSTNLKRDGVPRKLTIQVADGAKGEKRQGIIRETFTVPKN